MNPTKIKYQNESGKIESTIEIDCPPGDPRPNVLFESICKDILQVEPYDPISKVFGNWEWEVTYKDQDMKDKVEAALRRYYAMGIIRYAAW